MAKGSGCGCFRFRKRKSKKSRGLVNRIRNVLKRVTVGVTDEPCTENRVDGGDIPHTMRVLVEELERRGLENVGLYRVNGSKAKVKDLMTSRNLEQDVQEATKETICSSLKEFVRDLETPVLREDIVDQCLDKDIDSIRRIIRTMPGLAMFEFIISHLHRVSTQSETNKMTPDNLSTCWGPTLSQFATSLDVTKVDHDMKRLQTLNQLLAILIQNAPILFTSDLVAVDADDDQHDDNDQVTIDVHEDNYDRQTVGSSPEENDQITFHIDDEKDDGQKDNDDNDEVTVHILDNDVPGDDQQNLIDDNDDEASDREDNDDDVDDETSDMEEYDDDVDDGPIITIIGF